LCEQAEPIVAGDCQGVAGQVLSARLAFYWGARWRALGSELAWLLFQSPWVTARAGVSGRGTAVLVYGA